jgi:hypothetical protein
MSTEVLIGGAILIVALLIAAAWLLTKGQRSRGRQKTAKLREQFGSEYDRTLAKTGSRQRAEAELTARQERVSQLSIRPLAAHEGVQFNDEWQAVQVGFVDDPSVAVRNADALVGRVMDARGYPEGDFEQRFDDVSVDHNSNLGEYRAAHEIKLRHEQGQANTEDLRQAVVSDHALFIELIEEQATVEPVPDPAVPDPAVPDPAVPDSAVPDPAVPDSAVPDPAVPESAVPVVAG